MAEEPVIDEQPAEEGQPEEPVIQAPVIPEPDTVVWVLTPATAASKAAAAEHGKIVHEESAKPDRKGHRPMLVIETIYEQAQVIQSKLGAVDTTINSSLDAALIYAL